MQCAYVGSVVSPDTGVPTRTPTLALMFPAWRCLQCWPGNAGAPPPLRQPNVAGTEAFPGGRVVVK